MTFIHKTLIIPSVLDSSFNSSTVCEVKTGEVVYTTSLRMVCEVFCKRGKNRCGLPEGGLPGGGLPEGGLPEGGLPEGGLPGGGLPGGGFKFGISGLLHQVITTIADRIRGLSGYYTRTDNRPSYGEKRLSLEELMNKHQEESTRRSAQMDEWFKKLQENASRTTNGAQSSSIRQCKVVNADHEMPNIPISSRASVNVMPRGIFEFLNLTNLRKTNMRIEVVDMTKKAPLGVVENSLVGIDNFLFPSDFVIINRTPNETITLCGPFLATIHVKIHVFNREISLGVGNDRIMFDCMDWGEVNPVHAYYNGSCTSKDNEDPSWNTSFKTKRTHKTTSALEVLWKTLFLLYLYLIGTLLAMSSDNESSAVPYSSISFDSDGPSWGIPLVNADKLLEMDPYEEIYVLEPKHPKYLVPSDNDMQVEDQPYADDASPIAELPRYIVDSDSIEEDTDEDSIDYPDEPEDDDEDLEEDDDEDLEEDPEEDPNEEHEPEDEDTKEKEPSEGSDETELFEEDETVVTPPPPPRHHGARISAPLGYRAAMICIRDDIPKEDMPPRRRFILTAPPHGCDVAESYAAAARPPRGQAVNRVEDVGYVRALQASEHRMMTSIEEVNLRTDRRDIRLEIDVVRGQRTAYETELHESAKDFAVRHMMCTHVLEARARIDTVKDVDSSCVVGLSQWLENMESVFHISGCAIDNQVKFATYTLLGVALTWWNGHVRTLGRDVAYAMTWGTLKKKLRDKYCPKGEIKKLEIELWNLRTEKVDKYISGLPDNIHRNVISARPKTLDDTIELANDLMDQKLHTYAERTYTAGPGENKAYTRNLPLCTKCNYHHTGQCAPKCGNCKRYGHTTNDCRVNTNNNKNQKAGACYECGNTGHIRKNCPKLKNYGNGNGNGVAQGRAYALGGRDASPDSNVITGTFLLNNRYATILFDTGADRSFVSTTFSALINITPTTLENHYDVELADGKIIGVNTIIRGCTLNFMNHPFNIDLMPVPLGSFDVIIGMDWLTKYHGVIICDEKILRVPFGREMLIFQGNGNHQKEESRLNIISCTKAQEYLSKGCDVFLAHITTKEAKDKSEGKRLEDVPIVRDFPKVFPEDLPGISPARQVEFQIDLVPGAAPVARAPYRLAPSKMKELAEQLQELSDKGFIRPSFSP
ncbi:putative reverse transcriptase domain-containing protein [Tanacetum coccineum]|uniref:Reverse transcriptase domain-containing protein n=1 Tax=Tanacetum coccineum TaxID=301880 RepID=A0ABQ5GN61_9ASTR